LANATLTMTMKSVSTGETLSAAYQHLPLRNRAEDLPRTVERLVSAVDPHMSAKIVLSDESSFTVH